MKDFQNLTHDPLEEVELKIARRADQLAASSPLRTGLNLHWWTEAEREMLGTSWSPALAAPGAESEVAGGTGYDSSAKHATGPQSPVKR
jgi:hypothetical protein